MKLAQVVLGAAVVLSIGCDKKDDQAKLGEGSARPAASASAAGASSIKAAAASSDVPAAPASATATAAASASASPAGPAPSFSLEGVAAIADDCKEAYATAATAPESVGPEYDWAWTKQALLANPQFKINLDDRDPASGEVSFRLFQASVKFHSAWVLVARCGDGATCNRLVAMLRATTHNKSPQPYCGSLPMDLVWGTPLRPILRELGDPQRTLPGDDDSKGQCARLQACSVAADPSKAESITVGLDCQKAPHKFKRACSQKFPCSEVMTCLGQ